jgi:iron complex outermembrane receptor protein
MYTLHSRFSSSFFYHVREAQRRCVSTVSFFTIAVVAFSLPASSQAQPDGGYVAGAVRNAETGAPLAGVNVAVPSLQRGAATGPEGRFTIGPLGAGAYDVTARFVGYRSQTRRVDVADGDTARVQFPLAPRTVGLEAVEVTARRPDAPEAASQLREAKIQEANPRDAGDLVRNLSGTDAVRRGPVGLDPVVRGLRQQQVGVYVDGMRTMPAGPARMDSPLSHSGPSTMRSVEVVKGPYALTWGAGNMSTIRVKTNGLWATPSGLAHGQVQTGYDTNLNSYETTATGGGRRGAWAYRLDGAWRGGSAYTAGDGTTVPGDFLNRELRGKAGYRFSDASRLTVAGGYQQQDDVDYPGRLLSAEFFKSGRGRARYEYDTGAGLMRSLSAQAYGYQTLHTMNNEGKVTYESADFPGPPLRVTVNAEIQTLGGRVATELALTNELRLTLGADAYRAYRDADRPFQVVMGGEPKVPDFYKSDQIWPGVSIADAGVFAQATRLFGPVEATGTVRTDFVWAGANEEQVTNVYLDIAEPGNGALDASQLDQQEANVSGALMLSANLSEAWSLSVGGGTAMRTAGALERFADRFPANKAQTSAEFIGDPTLDPERSWQADAELSARYPRLSLKASAFARRIDDYITLTDAPDVDPMLPLPIFAGGPFRYANGEATFYGGEASAAYVPVRPLTVSLKGSYLWGRNETTDQPALGVAPFSADLGLRWEPPGGRFFVEGTLRAAAEQDRVATRLGETPTDGYVTADVKGGVDLPRGVSLMAGVTNLTGVDYVNHLNAKNPYAGTPIPEPGRVFFADVTYRF